MQVAGTGDMLEAIPPSHRFDIAIEQDLIEELAASTMTRSRAATRDAQRPADGAGGTRERLRLVGHRGYQEAITYSRGCAPARMLFPGRRRSPRQSDFGGDGRDAPVALARAHRALRFNLRRQHERVRLFEVGTRFEIEAGRLVESQRSPVDQRQRLAEQWGTDRRTGLRPEGGRRGLFATGRSAAISYVRAHETLHQDAARGWMEKLRRLAGQRRSSRSSRSSIPWIFELAIDQPARST
jgi:hypothetical protein